MWRLSLDGRDVAILFNRDDAHAMADALEMRFGFGRVFCTRS